MGEDVLQKGVCIQSAPGDPLGQHQKQEGGCGRKEKPRPVQPDGRSLGMVFHKEVPFTSAVFLVIYGQQVLSGFLL